MNIVQPLRIDDPWYRETLTADLAEINDNWRFFIHYEKCGIDCAVEVRLKDLGLAVAPEFDSCAAYRAQCKVELLISNLPETVTPANEDQVTETVATIDTLITTYTLQLAPQVSIKFEAVKSQLRKKG